MPHLLHQRDWKSTPTVFISRCTRSAVKFVEKGCLQMNDTRITWTCTRTSRHTNVQIVLNVLYLSQMSQGIFVMVFAQNMHRLHEQQTVLECMYLFSWLICNTFSGIFCVTGSWPTHHCLKYCFMKVIYSLSDFAFWESCLVFIGKIWMIQGLIATPRLCVPRISLEIGRIVGTLCQPTSSYI